MEYTKRRNLNRGYMKLDVWQKACSLFSLIYGIVYGETHIEFKLRSQIADAAQSVASNIAEGYSRRSIREYLQFLYIALGSLSETLTRSIGLKDTNLISSEQFEKIDVLHYEIENKLLKLVSSLEKKKDDGSWSDRIAEDVAEYNP